MQTEIEPNLPIPPRNSSMVRYPFSEMTLGDSFGRPKDEQKKLRVAASHYKKLHPGWNYETRVQGDLVRLWCVAIPPETDR